MKNFLKSLNRKLKIIKKAEYPRPEYNSYMSGPEWRNVEIAEEFAQFLKEGRSMFTYPYFSQVWDMCRVTYNSYRAASKYDSHKNILTSEYMGMDVMVTLFTMMELLPKGMLALVLRPFLKAENQTEMQQHLAAYFKEYSSKLQTLPFYDHPYAANRKKLAEAYQNAKDKTWGDWFGWKCISVELWARHWVSKPFYNWFHTEENLVTPATDVLVEFPLPAVMPIDEASKLFFEKMSTLKEKVSIVKEDEEKLCVYPEVETEGQQTTKAIYALLSANRYNVFQREIAELDDAGMQVMRIAGQTQVQVKCEINAPNAQGILQVMKDSVKHAELLYVYGDRIHPNRQICLFDVPTERLQETVKAFRTVDKAVSVKYIHNF